MEWRNSWVDQTSPWNRPPARRAVPEAKPTSCRHAWSFARAERAPLPLPPFRATISLISFTSAVSWTWREIVYPPHYLYEELCFCGGNAETSEHLVAAGDAHLSGNVCLYEATCSDSLLSQACRFCDQTVTFRFRFQDCRLSDKPSTVCIRINKDRPQDLEKHDKRRGKRQARAVSNHRGLAKPHTATSQHTSNAAQVTI